MALKKSDLRAILKNEDSTNEEKLSEILNMLHEEVDLVKDDRDNVQSKLDEAEKEIKSLKEASNVNADEWKEKYEKEHKDFEDYKTAQVEKANKEAQTKAFEGVLKEAGISDKMQKLIINTKEAEKVISGIQLGEDGKVIEADVLLNNIKSEYADYIAIEQTAGAKTITPPANNGTRLTKEQIYETDEHGRYKLSTEERQKALIKLSKGE